MMLLDYLHSHFDYYHLDDQGGCEVRTDSIGEWDDVQELITAGALSNAIILRDRHALIFPNNQQAVDALEELRENKVLA